MCKELSALGYEKSELVVVVREGVMGAVRCEANSKRIEEEGRTKVLGRLEHVREIRSEGESTWAGI